MMMPEETGPQARVAVRLDVLEAESKAARDRWHNIISPMHADVEVLKMGRVDLQKLERDFEKVERAIWGHNGAPGMKDDIIRIKTWGGVFAFFIPIITTLLMRVMK